jgi:hypothetical protein
LVGLFPLDTDELDAFGSLERPFRDNQIGMGVAQDSTGVLERPFIVGAWTLQVMLFDTNLTSQTHRSCGTEEARNAGLFRLTG